MSSRHSHSSSSRHGHGHGHSSTGTRRSHVSQGLVFVAHPFPTSLQTRTDNIEAKYLPVNRVTQHAPCEHSYGTLPHRASSCRLIGRRSTAIPRPHDTSMELLCILKQHAERIAWTHSQLSFQPRCSRRCKVSG